MINDDASGRDTPECVLYHGPGIASDDFGVPSRPADELLTPGDGATSPSVLLVDATLVAQVGDARNVAHHVVVVATDQSALTALGRRADISLAGITAAATREAILHAACQAAIARFVVMRSDEEFQELSRIGIALMREHDRKALLRLIVTQCKELTRSDGGGLLLKSEDDDGSQWLKPVLYAVDSIEGEFIAPETRIAVDDTSILGHAAIVKQPIAVADAYDLPRNAHYEQHSSFDKLYGYWRRSMLVVPMLDQLGHTLGVLVCFNRKTDPDAKIRSKEAAERYVIEYSDRELRLARMLAAQAAVAIENARLYAQLERALEGFVEASVSAIDLRDPATAGHSQRVAAHVTALAEAVERREDGPYRDVHFTAAQLRELHIAALLHDFGKVAVPEDLLLKAKKLSPELSARVDARFDLIRETMELASCRVRDGTFGGDGDGDGDGDGNGDGALDVELKELARCRDVVRAANEPTVLDAPTAAELPDIAARTYARPDGTVGHYLTPEELHYLQLPKGTLDDHERAEVESHVIATREYLSNIPWTDDLKNMVRYASGHHELLNGTGYPEHLAGDEIPLQTRIITVCDVFDALTASDRPYKPAMAPEKAIEMLRAEAADGRLDPEVVKVLAESEPHRQHPARNEAEL